MDIEEYEIAQDPKSMDSMLRRCMIAKNKLAIIDKDSTGKIHYSCVQCSIKCDRKEDLELHLLSHNDEYRYLCGICGTGLKRKEHMERHMYEHQQVRPHVCETCNKGFKRKEHLNIHRSIHTGDKTEVCVLCQKSFYRKDHLQKHLQTHGKQLAEQGLISLSEHELMNIKAEILEAEDGSCSGDVSQDDDMEENMQSIECDVSVESMRVDSERPYGCHLCEKTYKRKDHLKLHLQTHSSKDKVCHECGKAFHRDDQLMAHMSIHMNTYAQINKVDDDKIDLHAYLASQSVEPTDFLTDNALLVPTRVEVNDDDERRHECSICFRKFKRRQHLKVHYNVHTKHQPSIWCSKCSLGFYTNEDFENHQCNGRTDEINAETNDNPQQDAKKENEYPLEIIPIEEPKLDEVQYIQDESAIPVPKIVYVCKYCNKPFKRKDHYKIHLHIHTGIKSFFCPECGKGFYRKDHLQKHIQVHTKAKPKPKKAVPDLYPINMLLKKKQIIPEITIHAPSNTKLRVPLQIKVPYQVVMSMDNGEQRAVTVDPQSSTSHDVLS